MIIAVRGKIGSGKNTVVEMMNILCEQFGLTYSNFAFADKLKKVVSIVGDFPHELTLSQEGKNTYIESFDSTVGEMLQELGEGLRQGYRDDIWIKSIDSQIKNSNSQIKFITDLRYKNEYEYLKSIGAILISIRRTNNKTNMNSYRDTEHISETDLNDFIFDYNIDNIGTLEDLEISVNNLFENLYLIYKNKQDK